jgi:hypothetical protein
MVLLLVAARGVLHDLCDGCFADEEKKCVIDI